METDKHFSGAMEHFKKHWLDDSAAIWSDRMRKMRRDSTAAPNFASNTSSCAKRSCWIYCVDFSGICLQHYPNCDWEY